MSHDHTATAVALETQLIQSNTIVDSRVLGITFEELEVTLPQVCNDLLVFVSATVMD